MNSKITLPRLAAILAQRSGKSKKLSEDFIKAFFSTIAEAIQAGESVRVKGLGLFKLVRVEERKSVNVATGASTIIPAHDKLTFLPAKELAEAVNAPFSIFDTVELSDTYDPDEEPEMTAEGCPEPQDRSQEQEEDACGPSVAVRPDVSEELVEESAEETVGKYVGESAEESGSPINMRSVVPEEPAEELEKSAKEETETGLPLEEEELHPSEDVAVPAADARYASGIIQSELAADSPEPLRTLKTRRTFGKGFLIGFGCAMLLALIACGLGWYYLLGDARQAVAVARTRTDSISSIDPDRMIPTAPSDSADFVGTQLAASDSAKASASTSGDAREEHDSQSQDNTGNAAQKASETLKNEKPVYDNVTTSRYLTTIAREHYGNVQFWPYIYEENRDILGHPDRIRPGTKVVVPDLKKYGVDPRNKADEQKARQKGAAIYARYRR